MQEEEFLPDINDIVSISNILRYLDDNLEEQLNNPDRDSLMRVVGEFCRAHNKRSFINSLDLRNKYAHGSHWGTGEKEQEHEFNYFQMLKIMICIVLKVNDELCRKAESTR